MIRSTVSLVFLLWLDVNFLDAQFILPAQDEALLRRSKRHTSNTRADIENVRNLLKGFLKLSADVPLTPKRRSNFGSRPIGYKIIDRTEYAVNKKILNEVFESDLVLTLPQMKDIMSDFQRRISNQDHQISKRKAIVGDGFRWPNQIVPYVLKETDSEWRKLILNGIRKWEAETCIRFVERTNETDYVYVFRGAGCYSSVGRIGGRQYASIGYGCESGGIVAHELGHALGFWHEQSRPDRDKYININEEHIFRGTKGNFEKRRDIADLDTPYDFGSVMHYGPQAFSDDWNYLTIETKDHRFQHTIGQRHDLSFIDVKEANLLYCKDRCRVKLNCLYGGYEDPRNCAICKCPTGLAGRRCESIPVSTSHCGGELTALSAWQTLKSNTTGRCYWRISAPVDKVHFEVIDTSYSCESSCADNYLEIKHSTNLQQTGFRQCCNAAPGSFISETNQIYIISNAQKAPAEFELRYIAASARSALPKPPPAQWNGGGLTALIGAENGIDSTLEQYVIKQLPNTLRNFGRTRGNPWTGIENIVKSLLINKNK
ncbi:unnamed protein product [Anisakis simplex]|uniref:Metalloendopeptidase n=1 Tax=Anisakis simplex TaxID=6269 RepID=A0A0M3IYS1_ANISI|nr:unnamed protein product [Anisakis simplex]